MDHTSLFAGAFSVLGFYLLWIRRPFTLLSLIVATALTYDYYPQWVDFCYANNYFEICGETLDVFLLVLVLCTFLLLASKSDLLRLLYSDLPAWLDSVTSKSGSVHQASIPPPPPSVKEFSDAVKRILASRTLIETRRPMEGRRNPSLTTQTFAHMALSYLDAKNERTIKNLRNWLLENKPVEAEWADDVFSPEPMPKPHPWATLPPIDYSSPRTSKLRLSLANVPSTPSSGEVTTRSSREATELVVTRAPSAPSPLSEKSQQPEQISAPLESTALALAPSRELESDGEAARQGQQEQSDVPIPSPLQLALTAEPKQHEDSQQAMVISEAPTSTSTVVAPTRAPDSDSGHIEITKPDLNYPNDFNMAFDDIASKMHSQSLAEMQELVSRWQKNSLNATESFIQELQAQESDTERIRTTVTALNKAIIMHELEAIYTRCRIIVCWVTNPYHQEWETSMLNQAWIDSFRDLTREMSVFYQDLYQNCGHLQGCGYIGQVSEAVERMVAVMPLTTAETEADKQKKADEQQRRVEEHQRLVAEQQKKDEEQQRLAAAQQKWAEEQQKKAEAQHKLAAEQQKQAEQQRWAEEQRAQEQKKLEEQKRVEEQNWVREQQLAQQQQFARQQQLAQQQKAYQPPPSQPTPSSQTQQATGQAVTMPLFTVQQPPQFSALQTQPPPHTQSQPANGQVTAPIVQQQGFGFASGLVSNDFGGNSTSNPQHSSRRKSGGPTKQRRSAPGNKKSFSLAPVASGPSNNAMGQFAPAGGADFSHPALLTLHSQLGQQEVKNKAAEQDPERPAAKKRHEQEDDVAVFATAKMAEDKQLDMDFVTEHLSSLTPPPNAGRLLKTLDAEHAGEVGKAWFKWSSLDISGINDDIHDHEDWAPRLQKNGENYKQAMVVEERLTLMVEYAELKGSGWDKLADGGCWANSKGYKNDLEGINDLVDDWSDGESKEPGCGWLVDYCEMIAEMRYRLRRVHLGKEKRKA